MRRIDAFQTSDSKLFTNEVEAQEHEQNIIGELLDDFLPHDDRGNVTQVDRYNMLTSQMHDPKLVDKINKLSHALNFS